MSYSQKSFDDLSVKEFLKNLETLSSFSISAQLDGVQFYFGLDSESNFYTSPYSADKRTKFFYKVADYKLDVENNFYKAAHKALESKKKEIQEILKDGQAIECQLVASLDNASFSGIKSNKIILIRPIKGEIISPSEEQLDKIASLFSNKVEVKSSMLDTMDGDKLFSQKTISSWIIKKGKQISGEQLLSSSDIEKALKKVKKFLNKESDIEIDDKKLSVFDVLTINLGSVPVLIRDSVKEKRESLNKELLVKYKLPIKKQILLSAEDHFDNKSLFMSNGKNLISILDDDEKSKDKFDTEFKRELEGFIKNLDPKASLEDKGGIIGNCQIRIASLLGIPELARFQSAQKVFRSYTASTPEEIAVNFATNGLGQMNFYGVRTKIAAILNYTIEEVDKLLEVFKQHVNSFEMIDGQGKKITYSANQIKQNLLYFAQSKKQLNTLLSDIKKSKQMSDIVLALYSDPIHSILGKSLRESLFEGINPELKSLSILDADDICNAYTATLLSCLFLLRVQDKQTSKLLKDTNVFNKITPSISPLNYWGYVLFKSHLPEMQKVLNTKTVNDLKKVAGRVLMVRLNKVHRPISSSDNLKLDWDDMEQSCNLLAMRLSTRSQSINTIISGIRHWNDISLSDKITITNKLYFYLQRSVSNSPLLNRLRTVINLLAINAAKEDNLKKDKLKDIKENFLIFSSLVLNEEDMGSTTASTALSSVGYSGLSDFGDMGKNFNGNKSDFKANGLNKPSTPELDNDNFKKEVRFMNGKPIVKRKRDFIKKKKFERNPEDKKITEDAEASVTSAGDIATYPTRLFSKKKRVIKRIIPSTKLENKLTKLMKNSKYFKTIVSWNDEDYSGNFQTDEGVKYVQKQYGLSLSLLKEKNENGWPEVKIVGEYEKVVEFLVKDYGADEQFIKDHLIEIGEF